MLVIPSVQETEVGGLQSKAILPGQKYNTLSEKQTKSKRTGDVVQVVDYLPSKHEAQSSIHSTEKKRRG
jgi:hypothetical protein